MTTEPIACPCGTTYPAGDWCPNCEDALVQCRCGDLMPELDAYGDARELCKRCTELDRDEALAEDKWDEERDRRRSET